MFQSLGSKPARPANSAGLSGQSAPLPVAPGTSDLTADEAERQLAEDLEAVLKHKPSTREIRLERTPDDLGTSKVDRDAVTNVTLAEALVRARGTSAADNGFEWQTPGGAPQQSEASDTSERHDHDTALQWVTKARADKRRRAIRNVLGWLTTLVVGAALLGGMAHVLLGWQPDVNWLLQFGQKLASK